MDLRHLACILDQGRKTAATVGDAALTASLGAMMEAAIGYRLAEEAAAQLGSPALREEARGVWNLGRDWAELSERYR